MPSPRKARRVGAWAAFLCLVAAPPALSQNVQLQSNPTRWRAMVDYAVPDDCGDGWLAGLHFDLLDLVDAAPGLYLGFGGFGAVAGDIGGLWAAGPTLGWRRGIGEDWWIDLGAFVGGGGGEIEGPTARDVDGGLFLRPHVAVERALGRHLALRLEASRITNPGGDFESTQVGIGVSRLDSLLTARPSLFELRPLPRGTLEPDPEGLSVGLVSLDPSSGSRRRDGTPLDRRIALGRAGIELPIDDAWFVPLEIAGATAGGVDGYLQALGGIGWRRPWFRGRERVMDADLRLLAGAAGGGGVDTGGGLLATGEAGFVGHIARDWSMRLSGGYFVAPDGHFDGTLLALGVMWAPRAAALPRGFDGDRLLDEGLFARDHSLDEWRVALLHKSYFLPSGMTRKDGTPLDDDVHLVGAGASREILSNLSVSLRGFSAWDGDIGGYHEGQIGLRYDLDVLRTVEAGDVYVQYHAGAAGGGGVDVASGLVHEFAAGWRYPVRPSFHFGIEAGKLEADRGTFEGQLLAATFTWTVTRPLLK